MTDSLGRNLTPSILIAFLVTPAVADGLAPEVPDDPPAAVRAQDDVLARSPGMRALQGPYVSVQANVNELGQNIFGDAANEPSIAVNPTDRNNKVIGWRQFDSISSNFRQAGYAFTTDGGETWTFPGVLEPGVFRSDPVVGAAADGKLFYQSLTFDGGVFGLDVYRSLDGGATWPTSTPAFGGDKNWMVIDRTDGPGRDQIYEIWQRFASCCGLNSFSRSTDAGASFESPVPIDFWPTFGTMAVGPGGEVYAVGIDGRFGQDFDSFVVSKSTNARNDAVTPSFTGRVVDLGGSMELSSGPNPGGLLGQGTIAVSHAFGFSHGNVYVVASVNPNGSSDPLDVHFIRSTDGGNSWSAPLRVNDDDSTQNWQWFGAVAVGPRGRIDVIWYDTREMGQSNISQLYFSYSWDQGLTWSPNVAASPTFNSYLGFPNQSKIGDYIDLRSDGTGADVAYSATFNGEQDVYYVRLFPDCNDNAVSDVTDLTTGSSFDCNTNQIPDECEVDLLCSGSGEVPDGRFVDGEPLRIEPLETGELVLTWGGSCQPVDTDYEVYEGRIEDFYSHDLVYCSTNGELRSVVEPDPDHDTYYLIVPTNRSQEGSYGRSSDGAQRPPSLTPCRPPKLSPCLAGP